MNTPAVLASVGHGSLVEARGIYKALGQTPALRGANVTVRQGEIFAIMGPSGSGKSTLLHCLAGIFTPDQGDVLFDGQLVNAMSEADRTKLRRTAFGFVFQFGQLVPELTAADNIALPLLLNRTKRKVAYKTASTWLDRLGIGDKGGRRTGELSGGEAQRVAVGRALALAPKVIFADEPTGSLDSLTGEKVMDLLTDLARQQGATVVLVTHEARVAAYADRVAMVRVLITAAAVAVGVALLLGVLAEFHAFQVNANKQCWSCTEGASVPSTLPSHGELWNNSVDFYRGQTINRLDVASLGPNAPVPPGITQLPPAGDYYASPALAALLKTVPAGQLGARFPGKMIGTIGQAGLNGSGDLAIYIGYTPAQLNKIPGTAWVTSIYRAPGQEVWSPFFRYAFGVGVLAVVFPMLVLISTATRLAAARREERFAALRLVGGTPCDIRIVASVEAMISAFLGAVLGTVIFLLVRPALAGAALIGTQYFESDLTPTAAGYVAMLAGVPVAAAIAALVSLRRVQISPLGVTRRATPKPPRFWRLVVLVICLGVFVYGLSRTTRDGIGGPAYPGLLLTMIGLVIAGPWLTAWAARLFGRVTSGPSALLATRRLADNPRRAARAVTGLVLAVFLGTMVGLSVPAVNATEATPTAGALSNILVGQVGLPAAAGQKLISGISAIPGAAVYPLYELPPPGGASGPSGSAKPGPNGQPGGVPSGSAPPGPQQGNGAAKQYRGSPVAVSCADMRAVGALGQCAAGVKAVQVLDVSLFDDNPIYDTKPIVSAPSQPYTGDL